MKPSTRTLAAALLGLVLLLARPAAAAEFAVLELQAYGLAFDDGSLVAQGLRDAILEEGSWFPLSVFDMADRAVEGHEDEIDRARNLVTEARRAIEIGQAGRAWQKLSEAIRLHEAAGSYIARQAELSDVYFYAAEALLRLGRRTQAVEHLVRTLDIYPGYDTRRAPAGMREAMRRAFEQARSLREARGPVLPDTDEVVALQRRMRVDGLAVGYVKADGTILLRAYRGERLLGEVQRTLETVPPFPGDPIYLELVAELTGGGAGARRPEPGDAEQAYLGASAAPPSPADPAPGTSTGGFAELPDFDAPPAEGPPSDDLTAGTQPEIPDRSRGRRRPFWRRRNQGSTIRGAGGMHRLGREPITRRWWFWAATGVVVAGGATTAVVLLVDLPIENGDATSGAPETWSATVDLGTGG